MNTVAAIEPRHAAGQRLRERIFRGATLTAALVVLALVVGVGAAAIVLPSASGWTNRSQQFHHFHR